MLKLKFTKYENIAGVVVQGDYEVKGSKPGVIHHSYDVGLSPEELYNSDIFYEVLGDIVGIVNGKLIMSKCKPIETIEITILKEDGSEETYTLNLKKR